VFRYFARCTDEGYQEPRRNRWFVSFLNSFPDNLFLNCINFLHVAGFVNAHIKDAAALCCYFAWLEKEVESGHRVTEISAADHLAALRAEHKDFVGLSFDTISSSGKIALNFPLNFDEPI
jgi:hypothetical protein